MVIIDHLVKTLVVHSGFRNAAVIAFTSHIGHVGVLAFFVHTSLVLMYSVERLSRSEDQVSLRFYIRRFFRIYPLAIFVILLAVTLHIPQSPFGGLVLNAPRVVLSNLMLVQNIFGKDSVLGPLWSLPYEVQMYIVLPALYLLTQRKHAVLYLCGLFLFFVSFGFLLFSRTSHLNMAAYVPCFLSGVICYSLKDRLPAFAPSALWPAFVLALIGCYCITNSGSEPNFWIGWLFCLLLGLAINAFRDSANQPLNAVAEKVALYSYGIYLNQIPVLYLVFMVLGIRNKILGSALFLVVTMVAAAITYHLIESPCIRLGKRISAKLVLAPVLRPASVDAGSSR